MKLPLCRTPQVYLNVRNQNFHLCSGKLFTCISWQHFCFNQSSEALLLSETAFLIGSEIKWNPQLLKISRVKLCHRIRIMPCSIPFDGCTCKQTFWSIVQFCLFLICTASLWDSWNQREYWMGYWADGEQLNCPLLQMVMVGTPT